MGKVSSGICLPAGSRRQPLLSRNPPPGSGPTCSRGAGREHRRAAARRSAMQIYGKSVQRDLLAGRFEAPAAVEQESAAGKRADLLARGGLGAQESGGEKEWKNG